MKGSIMFEVGDVVIGLGGGYGITCQGTIWTVTGVDRLGNRISLSGNDLSPRRGSFDVRASDFALVSLGDAKPQKIEVIKEKEVKYPSKQVEESVLAIKDAGFSHIKVELEGELGRSEDGEDCYDCSGTGSEDCSNCDGEGFVDSGNRTRLSDEAILEECSDCYGEGYSECRECDGSGNRSNYMSEDSCEEFMRDYVGSEINSRLTYGNFYEDGSVDSEFTFTLPIEYVADVIEWQKAFVALSDHLGGQLDVDGAGLHIAILPKESNGYYPVEYNTLDYNKVSNFTTQITKLMPALFFLASGDGQSRGLGYRHPQVASEKYSAISTHDNSCFEYRVFETCYFKPERFYDYLETIANTLKFYKDPELTVESLGKEFGFSSYGSNLSRFYDTPEQLRILNHTIKHLKPKSKSYKKLKQERGMDLTIKDLQKRKSEKVKKLREDYKVYKQRRISMLTPTEREQLRNQYIREGYRPSRARAMANNTAESFRDFVRRNMHLDELEMVLV